MHIKYLTEYFAVRFWYSNTYTYSNFEI